MAGAASIRSEGRCREEGDVLMCVRSRVTDGFSSTSSSALSTSYLQIERQTSISTMHVARGTQAASKSLDISLTRLQIVGETTARYPSWKLASRSVTQRRCQNGVKTTPLFLRSRWEPHTCPMLESHRRGWAWQWVPLQGLRHYHLGLLSLRRRWIARAPVATVALWRKLRSLSLSPSTPCPWPMT